MTKALSVQWDWMQHFTWSFAVHVARHGGSQLRLVSDLLADQMPTVHVHHVVLAGQQGRLRVLPGAGRTNENDAWSPRCHGARNCAGELHRTPEHVGHRLVRVDGFDDGVEAAQEVGLTAVKVAQPLDHLLLTVAGNFLESSGHIFVSRGIEIQMIDI